VAADGKLTLSEVVAGLDGLGFDLARAMELFRLADQGGKGWVGVEEFSDSMAALWLE
jgi:hypothetical protein